MKGNVTCSCGHSWSKLDSSKKDATVCHICGKDNTMKDGGWLDKYNDGGELDESALSSVKNVLSKVGDVTSAPARGLTYLATGKYQDPSEAMGITNPYGAFATDLVLDPMNLVGAGLLKLASGPSKLSKVTKAAGKLSKAADVTSAVKNYKSPDIKLDPNKFPGPKNIPINPKQFNQAVKSTLSALTERGQKLDQVTGGKFNVTPDDIHYHGTFGGRPIVEVKTPYGSEHFYKSTGWAGKKEINPGQWQAFGQWMDAPAGTVRPNSINDWFVKGPGFDKFYGSQSFGNVANSLDDALIKKYNVPSEDLNKFLNFQNMQSDANTFIPKRKDGGWLDKYQDGGELNYNDSNASAGPGFQGDGYSNVGRNYSPAWGGQFAMGGSIPGSVGFMYARTNDPAPSNGKYAKKTKASAENGAEMKYYQNGLDWKPRSMDDGGVVDTFLDPIINAGKSTINYFDNLVKTGIDKLSAMDTPTPVSVTPNKIPNKIPKKVPVIPKKDIYDSFYDLYDKSPIWNSLDNSLYDDETYSKDENRIKLNTGRFTGANVSSSLINDLAEAAKRNNIPVGQLLTLAGRESTFGEEKGHSRHGDTKELYTSGWNVAEQYFPYDETRFLADKKVPGISVVKNLHGWTYKINNEKAAREYVNKNPQLLDQYKKKLDSTPSPGNRNLFDLSAEFLKKKGIKGYNPGDPRYEEMFQKDYDTLKQDKALMSYLKKKGYKYEQGGQLTKLDQLTNFSNYNTKQPGGWLDKYQ